MVIESGFHGMAIETTHDEAHELTEHDESWKGTLLMLPVFLIIGNAIRHLTIETRSPIPYTVILLCVGMLLGYLESHTLHNLGTFGEGILSIKNINPHFLLAAFLPPLIFESAFGAEWHVMLREFGQSLTLAFPGVLINTMLTAIFCVYAFPYSWTWAEAITFGSIVSATDPVAVVSILKELGASKRLATLIEGESLLNDGSAFVLYVIALQFVKGENPSAGDVVSQFCVLSFGGILMGIAFGLISVIWLRLVFNDVLIEVIITVSSCFLVYWVNENAIHASGVLGVVFLGLTLSKYKSAVSPQVAESMEAFWEVFSYVMNTFVFLFAGVIVVIGVFEADTELINAADFGWNFLLYLILHLTRGITIGCLWWPLSHMGYGATWKEGIVLTLAGLRGVIALSLAMMTKLEEIGTFFHEEKEVMRYKDLVLFHVSGIVGWTLIINGTFIKYIVQYLGLTKTSEQAQIVLKDTMRHLRKSTKIKMLGMKGDPAFSGANWEEVTRSLPSYAHVLGGKDSSKKAADCCTISRRDEPLGKTLRSKTQKNGNIKYAPVQTSSAMHLRDENGGGVEHMTRFGITSKSFRFLPTQSEAAVLASEQNTNYTSFSQLPTVHDEKEDEVEIAMSELEHPKMTEIEVANGHNEPNEEEEIVNQDTNRTDVSNETWIGTKPSVESVTTSVGSDEVCFFTQFNKIETRQESEENMVTKKKLTFDEDEHHKPDDHVDHAHIHNTIELMLQPPVPEDAGMSVIAETEGCKKQIQHRVLLVLQRAYHEIFEEGIISVDSYNILDHAISCGLDSDNLDELNAVIRKTLKLNKFVTWMYNKTKFWLTQYMLMKELSTAIEVGMIFIGTFELLADKLKCVPSISQSPMLQDIMKSLKDQVVGIKKQWEDIHELYPEVYNSVQTRHAVQRIIHHEAKDVEKLFHRGLFDAAEYVKMTKALLKTEHKLYFSSFYYVSSISSSEQCKKQTLLSMIFMTKLQKHTATYQDKVNYLFKHVKPELFKRGDTIIKKGGHESPNGFYVLVSGITSFVLDDEEDDDGLSYQKTLNVTKGSIIGGYSYLTGTGHLSEYVATTPSDLYFIEEKVLNKILKNEPEAMVALWRQIATNVMLSKFWRNNTSFFAFYGKTNINIMCQQSTFRHFKSKDQKKRTLSLKKDDMALLLHGDAFCQFLGDANHNWSDESPTNRFRRRIFKAPAILLPLAHPYSISQNGKVLVLDHRPEGKKKAAGLSAGRNMSSPRKLAK